MTAWLLQIPEIPLHAGSPGTYDVLQRLLRVCRFSDLRRWMNHTAFGMRRTAFGSFIFKKSKIFMTSWSVAINRRKKARVKRGFNIGCCRSNNHQFRQRLPLLGDVRVNPNDVECSGATCSCFICLMLAHLKLIKCIVHRLFNDSLLTL